MVIDLMNIAMFRAPIIHDLYVLLESSNMNAKFVIIKTRLQLISDRFPTELFTDF